jgi:hypothetical protein
MNVSFYRRKRTSSLIRGVAEEGYRICHEETFKLGAVIADFGQAGELEYNSALIPKSDWDAVMPLMSLCPRHPMD